MRGGVEARMITALGMYYGEHYLQQARDTIFSRPMGKESDKNKLFLVFNLLKRAARRKIGHLYRANHGFHASPDVADPKAYDGAIVIDKMVKALNKRLREPRQKWTRYWWTVLCGVAIEHTPWIEQAGEEPMPQYDEETNELLWKDAAQPGAPPLKQSQVKQMITMGMTPERFSPCMEMQMVGEVGSEIISPLNFFIDSSVPAIDLLGPDQACYIVQCKTVDWIEETFGSDAAAAVSNNAGRDLGIVKTRLLDQGPAVANINLKDLIPAIQGSQGPNDPRLCLFATRYQPACRDFPHGRRSLFIINGETLDDGETDYGEIPCTDFHYGPPATTFWTEDFLTDGIAPQKFLNKRFSQYGEASNSQIYETLLLGGGLGADDIPTDKPGVVVDGLNEEGGPNVVALQHAQLPAFFPESIKQTIQMLQGILGSDITDKTSMPTQIRGPMALPLFQEILDSEDGPLFAHLAEQTANVHQQRINRVAMFYPPIRTMQYTGKNRKDEVMVFHAEKILRSGTNYLITIDPGTIMPEFSALREAKIIERMSGPLAGLYVSTRTGKIDFSKIATELRFNVEDDDDSQTRNRDLARHIISRIWQGDQISMTMPEIPYPFWDHNAWLDELEIAMIGTEYLESSQQVKTEFITLYEKHRQMLAGIQESQMQAIQGQMMQGMLAQVSQQTAARVASETIDQTLGQIHAAIDNANRNSPARDLASASQQDNDRRPQLPAGPQPPRQLVAAQGRQP